ncbi:DUF4442 domain-containing protein [Olleya sp. YS]|uniref:DUF4442 domain-containing protein n=1 Tax=Olleya sp. YS TaxID=3028318 RepID=UPI0024346234|nr:DUF4442 domain-containing protein [Olleya sp. YS]WGD35036.1 DUF4442 domain-containing protein [Olleya sp. YS]
MKISPSKLNAFTMLKLPSAYFCGVRTKVLNDQQCITTVKHRWINQNPFNSMFWAVQGMAAEFATGAMMMMKIKSSGKKVSMLVTSNNATFTKKATGRITFVCDDGHKVDQALAAAIKTGDGQTVTMQSIGTNQEGLVVSTFNFEWSIKVKG